MADTGGPLYLTYVEPNSLTPDVPLRDMMDKVNANAIKYAGTWNSATAYFKGDVVVYSNALYQANTGNTNKTPGVDSQWDLWLQGVIGADGADGPKGDPGNDGNDGTNFIVNAIDVIANRGTYDGEAAGFTFLSSDESKLYMRVGSSGWSAGVPFGGIADNRIVIAGGFFGSPGSSQSVLRYISAIKFTLPVGLTGSQYHNDTNPTATTVFDIQANGSSVGSMSISTAGAATFTFASLVTINAGDILSIIAPATSDATIADGTISLLGEII